MLGLQECEPLEDDNQEADLEQDQDQAREGESDVDDADTDDSDDSAYEDDTFFPALMSLHRELHPPMVALPRSLLASTSSRHIATQPDDDELMDVDTDDEALMAELEAEDALDEHDEDLDMEYEAILRNHLPQ